MTRKPYALPDSNPKSAYGTAKPGIHGVPVVALLHCGNGMRDGVEKYGLTNWRENSVAASVYYNAAFRHLASWWDGEQNAEDSGVHHLGHVMACCAILLDAEAQGNLIDDRPSVPGKFSEMVKAMTKTMNRAIEDDDDDDDYEEDSLSELFDFLIEDDDAQDWFDATVKAIWGAENLDHAREELREAILAANEDPGQKWTLQGEGWEEEWTLDKDIPGTPYLSVVVSLDGGADGDFEFGVPVRPEISFEEMNEIVARFLAGDAGNKKLAVFNNCRHHIGSFQTSAYTQTQRTQLAFYLESDEAGVKASLDNKDQMLASVGFRFG